jgi:hypothetical protein
MHLNPATVSGESDRYTPCNEEFPNTVLMACLASVCNDLRGTIAKQIDGLAVIMNVTAELTAMKSIVDRTGNARITWQKAFW